MVFTRRSVQLASMGLWHSLPGLQSNLEWDVGGRVSTLCFSSVVTLSAQPPQTQGAGTVQGVICWTALRKDRHLQPVLIEDTAARCASGRDGVSGYPYFQIVMMWVPQQASVPSFTRMPFRYLLA